jgi:hypothetical protein
MSFWDNVIQDTPGMLLPPPENAPFDHLLGTAAGLNPSVNNAGAQAVHPSLSTDPNSPDSLVKKAGQPAGFELEPGALSPDIFASWHTAYQEEYVNKHKDADGFVTIGAGADAIHVTLSSAQDKVFILEALQKADFSTMALADQTRIATANQRLIATDPNFHDVLGKLGLVADHNVVDGPDSPLQKAIDTINSIDPKDAASFVHKEDKDIFLKELSNIQTKISQMGVFSPTDINAAVQAISDRFKRVAVFAKAVGLGPPVPAPVPDITPPPNPPLTADPNQFINVISLDNNAAINKGLQAFMNSEKQILAADNAAMQISNTGTLEGLTKHLDAPNLVAAFQLDANLKDQAINAGDTEEINQINELLKTYNAIQELINQTIATFDAAHNDEKRGLLGYDHNSSKAANNQGVPKDTIISDGHGGTITIHPDLHDATDVLTHPISIDDGKLTPPELTDEQIKVISMFEQELSAKGLPKSPIEELLGITRPTFDFYDNVGKTLNNFEKSTWDQWSATLGNTVQQISQENQLKFNDINTLEKERTTHFQSATNALTKALDITSTIGRNLA